MSKVDPERRRLTRFLMLAVFLWGSIIAFGVLLFGYDPLTGGVQFSPNVWRGLVVEAAVLAFIGFWWVMLFARNR